MPTGRSGWRAPNKPIAVTIGEYREYQLDAIEEVIINYHNALDARTHGGIAESNALNAIEAIMGMYWRP